MKHIKVLTKKEGPVKAVDTIGQKVNDLLFNLHFFPNTHII